MAMVTYIHTSLFNNAGQKDWQDRSPDVDLPNYNLETITIKYIIQLEKLSEICLEHNPNLINKYITSINS